MIGHQRTGALPGVVISAVVMEDGTVVASGRPVAKEVQAVAVNLYRQFLQGKGHLRVLRPLVHSDES